MTSKKRKARKRHQRDLVDARKPTPPVDVRLGAAIDEAMELVNGLNAAPYDGVRGQTPAWVPKPLEVEFQQRREALLAGPCETCETTHTADEVFRWIANYRNAMRPIAGFRSVGMWPRAHERDIRDLVYIQDIASLGEAKGIKAYLGKGRYQVIRGRAVAQERRRQAAAVRDRRALGNKNSAKSRGARASQRFNEELVGAARVWNEHLSRYEDEPSIAELSVATKLSERRLRGIRKTTIRTRANLIRSKSR